MSEEDIRKDERKKILKQVHQIIVGFGNQAGGGSNLQRELNILETRLHREIPDYPHWLFKGELGELK